MAVGVAIGEAGGWLGRSAALARIWCCPLIAKFESCAGTSYRHASRESEVGRYRGVDQISENSRKLNRPVLLSGQCVPVQTISSGTCQAGLSPSCPAAS